MLLAAKLLPADLCFDRENKISLREKSLGETEHHTEMWDLSPGKLILGFCFFSLVTKYLTCEKQCLGPPKASTG